MRKAYAEASSEVLKTQKEEEPKFGSASLMVLNGEKLVMANMGNYGVVMCKDGAAKELIDRHKPTASRNWSRRIFPVRQEWRQSDGSGIVVRSEKIDWETDFVVLASSGIWEVMKTQESVNLIMHIQDPKEVARCLTN